MNDDATGVFLDDNPAHQGLESSRWGLDGFRACDMHDSVSGGSDTLRCPAHAQFWVVVPVEMFGKRTFCDSAACEEHFASIFAEVVQLQPQGAPELHVKIGGWHRSGPTPLDVRG